MSFIDEVRADRQPLAHVLKKHHGIRKIVEELYPDRAHFIYELLQNAEDTKATEVSFVLQEDKLTFVHNGRAFTNPDLLGITDIGEGTKVGDDDKIGRFGVGFKAVFAFSETPHIWSSTYSFKISDLVLPTEIDPKAELGNKTCFEFPFNNPKKSHEEAFTEIKAGLEELTETTLLFLRNLKTISWQICKHPISSVRCVHHSEHHIEILIQVHGGPIKSSHYLRFSAPVKEVKKQHLALAYELDLLPNRTTYVSTQKLSEQMRIVSANPGRVAVYFPARKETSGLRFHLHAPFVPELSRASIKETSVNDTLYEQLSRLAAESLPTIRDLGLLSAEFLAVLPNSEDVLPEKYKVIRTLIVAAMNDEPLTPTYSKAHAPAKYLLQGKAALKELLDSNDLEYLITYEEVAPQWAVAAPLKNSSAERFLSSLSIKEWDVDKLCMLLRDKTSANRKTYRIEDMAFFEGPDQEFLGWLEKKSPEWHQSMYAILFSQIRLKSEWQRQQMASEMAQWQIIRLSNGKHSIGTKCFFPSVSVVHDEVLPRVDARVYTSGKLKTRQQEEAKAFLELIGVHEVGEADQVKAILEQRYKAGESFQPDLKDLERFVALWEKDVTQADIFSNYCIFKRTDSKWCQPGFAYLDAPFKETGLSAYYTALGNTTAMAGLSEEYQHYKVPVERLVKYADAVGVHTRLEFERTSCYGNPKVNELVHQSQGRWSDLGINEDYTIKGMAEALATNNEALSRLMWNTARKQRDTKWLLARYRKNSSYICKEALSQIGCILRDTAWIPQKGIGFVRPAEACRELLPQGFPFDEGYPWLSKIKFGETKRTLAKESARDIEKARELGFTDMPSLERALKFINTLPKDEQERILSEYERKPSDEFPKKEPKHPERRTEKISQQAKEAPERLFSDRTRSVSVNQGKVKLETDQYLRDQYTNDDGIMFCQICQKQLPFKLNDGLFYFEMVEFLLELRQHHYQNYLALCPNHSAMFKHANGSRSIMMKLFSEIKGLLLDVILADTSASILFTKTHIIDLQAVISSEAKSAKNME
ncbi:hypothetical protein EBZ37_00355 [bacterium]|nr:hypothetical protein [bacterium]